MNSFFLEVRKRLEKVDSEKAHLMHIEYRLGGKPGHTTSTT